MAADPRFDGDEGDLDCLCSLVGRTDERLSRRGGGGGGLATTGGGVEGVAVEELDKRLDEMESVRIGLGGGTSETGLGADDSLVDVSLLGRTGGGARAGEDIEEDFTGRSWPLRDERRTGGGGAGG